MIYLQKIGIERPPANPEINVGRYLCNIHACTFQNAANACHFLYAVTRSDLITIIDYCQYLLVLSIDDLQIHFLRFIVCPYFISVILSECRTEKLLYIKP